MQLDIKKIIVALALLVALGGLAAFLWVMLHRTTAQQGAQGGSFGSSGDTTQTGVNFTDTLPSFGAGSGSTISAQPIFKIADGPVVSAELLVAQNPTTTVARYITAEDGHVLEVPLDVAGAVPHIVSNTTIPGIERAVWTEQGNAIIQYLDSGHVKTATLTLPAAQGAATSSSPAFIHFLPDDTADVAPSPDGSLVAYLLRTSAGTDGYTSKLDGSNAKKLFSLPLRELLLSWPATTTVVASGKSGSGTPGIIFSINTKTGAANPLLYGLGLTATANPLFSSLVYRTDDGDTVSLFAEDPASGATTALPLADTSLSQAIPETCAWTVQPTLRAFCAAPLGEAGPGFLDLWHRGEASAPDAIIAITGNAALPVVTPGSRDGGEPSDIVTISVSPDGSYLSFVSKNTGTLWGVRLK